MQRFFQLPLVVTVLALGSPAVARSANTGTNDIIRSIVTSFVQTANGNPVVCGIQFTIAYHDWLNENGVPSFLEGGLSLIHPDYGKLAFIIQLMGEDDPGETGHLISYRPSQVGLFSLSGGEVKPLNSIKCEEPAVFCAVAPAINAISAGLMRDDLHIRFNRLPGGLDTDLPLRIKKPALTRYFQCGIQVLSSVQKEVLSAK